MRARLDVSLVQDLSASGRGRPGRRDRARGRVRGLRVVAPQVPGALVLVVGGLFASYLVDLGDHGVALVGAVPTGLPSVAVSDFGLMWDKVIPVALGACSC